MTYHNVPDPNPDRVKWRWWWWWLCPCRSLMWFPPVTSHYTTTAKPSHHWKTPPASAGSRQSEQLRCCIDHCSTAEHLQFTRLFHLFANPHSLLFDKCIQNVWFVCTNILNKSFFKRYKKTKLISASHRRENWEKSHDCLVGNMKINK